MSPEQIKAKLKRFGLSGVNKPKKTSYTSHEERE